MDGGLGLASGVDLVGIWEFWGGSGGGFGWMCCFFGVDLGFVVDMGALWGGGI